MQLTRHSEMHSTWGNRQNCGSSRLWWIMRRWRPTTSLREPPTGATTGELVCRNASTPTSRASSCSVSTPSPNGFSSRKTLRRQSVIYLIFSSFVDDRAPVREKMLLAATCATFKSEFGQCYIEHEKHVTDRKVGHECHCQKNLSKKPVVPVYQGCISFFFYLSVFFCLPIHFSFSSPIFPSKTPKMS